MWIFTSGDHIVGFDNKLTAVFCGTISPKPIVVKVINIKYSETGKLQSSSDMSISASSEIKTVMKTKANHTGTFNSVVPSVLKK